MATYTVQVILASDQPGPNICALIDESIRPDEVVIATQGITKDKNYTLWMQEACKSVGLSCSVVELPNIWEIEKLRNTFAELINKRLSKNHSLILNSTGGENSVSIIANDIFTRHKLPVFYVHDDWVRWLNKPNDETDFNLRDKIKIPTYFLANGLYVKKFERSDIPSERRKIAHSWHKNSSKNAFALGKLNFYCSQAQNDLRCKIKEEELKGYSLFNQQIDQILDAGLATLEKGWLTFTDESARFFVNGGWLEEHVFSELSSLREEIPELQDVARSVEFRWLESSKQTPVINELDVVALYDNRLIVIECKTGKMLDGAATPLIYKFGSLVKNLGGKQTTGLITSFHEIAEHLEERAKLFDVQICDAKELNDLRTTLKKRLAEPATY